MCALPRGNLEASWDNGGRTVRVLDFGVRTQALSPMPLAPTTVDPAFPTASICFIRSSIPLMSFSSAIFPLRAVCVLCGKWFLFSDHPITAITAIPAMPSFARPPSSLIPRSKRLTRRIPIWREFLDLWSAAALGCVCFLVLRSRLTARGICLPITRSRRSPDHQITRSTPLPLHPKI